jgi:hypothetical protein
MEGNALRVGCCKSQPMSAEIRQKIKEERAAHKNNKYFFIINVCLERCCVCSENGIF